MERCPGCKEPVRWYHRKGPPNEAWHRQCGTSWSAGYDCARGFADDMCKRVGQKTPGEIYWETNPYRSIAEDNKE